MVGIKLVSILNLDKIEYYFLVILLFFVFRDSCVGIVGVVVKKEIYIMDIKDMVVGKVSIGWKNIVGDIV